MKKYTNKQINKAWDCLRDVSKTPEEKKESYGILSEWRMAHVEPLECAFEQIKSLVMKYDSKGMFAKRLKRLESIQNKLNRFDKMELSRIYDIWWARVIASSPKKFRKILLDMKKMPNFLKEDGSLNIKDYSNPKKDGYRSIHFIWKFWKTPETMRNIEVQLRTLPQHYWATALEIVDIFTKQKLKSDDGEKDWKRFFACVSKEIQIIETIHLFNSKNPSSLSEYYKKIKLDKACMNNHIETKQLIKKLDIVEKFNWYRNSLKIATDIKGSKKGYVLIITDIFAKEVTVKYYEKENVKQAESDYIEHEKRFTLLSDKICVLVATSTLGDIQKAYPNYFADSIEFLKYVRVIERSPHDINDGWIIDFFKKIF